MTPQVVLIQQRLDTAVAIKQALEQHRLYEVFPFTHSQAALEYVRHHAVDYILIDMTLTDYQPLQLIRELRQLSPPSSIIVSTSDSNKATQALSAGAVEIIDVSYNARKLLDVLDRLAISKATSRPHRSKKTTKRQLDQDQSVSARLAAEEPPMPGLFQGGTITTYMSRVSDEEMNNLLDAINKRMELPPMEDEEPVDEDTPAQFILEDVTDETLPLEDRPFAAYLKKLRNDADTARYTREPNFLEEEPTTAPAPPPPEQPKKPTPPPPPPTLPESEPAPDLGASARINIWDWDEAEETEAADTDIQVAQMAVSLTQASLESTADATLLTADGEIVAYEGSLSDEDIQEVVSIVSEGAQGLAPGQSRVQFVKLNSTRLDYLLFSRQTEDDYLLSMAFEGQTPITEIRQQAKRLLSALNSVPALPEPAPPAALPEPSKGGARLEADADVDVGPLTHYTFLWLPRNANTKLQYATTEAINAGLRVQMVERGWQVDLLEVQESYVYLVAGVPGEEPPQSLVRNLQTRAANIATTQNPSLNPQTLWADSYFVLSPGRELNLQEIQQYISFYHN